MASSIPLSSPLPLEGDLLLSGVILKPNEEEESQVAWCGGGAGQIRLPTQDIDLAGTTFYAHPWYKDSATDPLFDQCPNPQE